jgi:ribose transport system substrate-binding protein
MLSFRGVCLAAVAVVLALGLAACGSSSSTDSTAESSAESTSESTGAGAASAGVAAATKVVEEHQVPEPKIELAQLAKRPAPGKTINYVSCQIEICQIIQKGAEEATAALGWKFELAGGGLAPEEVTAAWDTIAQNPGDGVIATAVLPNSAISKQLSVIQKDEIPYVAINSPSPIGDGMVANMANRKELTQTGEILADWITMDSGGDGNVAFFWDPSFQTHKAAEEGFRTQLEKNCPDCSLSVATADFISGIGKTVPQVITSYVQAHPDVEYVVVNLGDAAAGVADSLDAAGLGDQVKLVTRALGPANLENIAEENVEAAGVTEEAQEVGWRAVDVLARYYAEESFDPEPVGVLHLIDKSDLPEDLTVPWTTPNYQKYFLEAWNVE